MAGVPSEEKKRVFAEVKEMGTDAWKRFCEIRDEKKREGEPARTAWQPAYRQFMLERTGENVKINNIDVSDDDFDEDFMAESAEVREATMTDFQWAAAHLGTQIENPESAPSKIAYALWHQGREHPTVSKSIIEHVRPKMKESEADEDMSDIELTALEERIVEGFDKVGKQVAELCKCA